MTRPKRDRLRDQATAIWRAQGKFCFLCGAPMVPSHRHHVNRRWSVDHVRPRSRGYGRAGNLLVAHKGCNNRKGDREPTGCELILLDAVNARLGLEWIPQSYSGEISGPSALALAFEQARAA